MSAYVHCSVIDLLAFLMRPKKKKLRMLECFLGAGNQEGVNRSEWYSYNPMSSVTTLGGSGSDGASTLGEVDQSGQDFVLMASPIRGGPSSSPLFWSPSFSSSFV